MASRTHDHPGERKKKRISRRKLLRSIPYGIVALWAADSFLLEPTWLAVTHVRLGDDPYDPIVHICDLHYKGDDSYLGKIVKVVNATACRFVCFTGDIVEDRAFLEDALSGLADIRHPVFAVPGNHEHWSGSSLKRIDACLRDRGGRLLVNESLTYEDFEIVGVDDFLAGSAKLPATSGRSRAWRSILLTHTPIFVDTLQGEKFDLILAGHSHGGQVRLPLLGAPVLPPGVGNYQKGLYRTPAGPIHVSVGLGTYSLRLRFLCRPEVAVIEF